jgi:hypothetical protein
MAADASAATLERLRDKTPYGCAAQRYFDAGWWPIPVFGDDKAGIPSGVTGNEGKAVVQTDINRWLRSYPAANIALRLPPDLVGIDIDNYGEKPGVATMQAMIEKCGPLPPTVVATARDLPSGKYLYRVPMGTRLRGKVGPGVEIIQSHHRYVVCAPSVHHTGAVVRWIDEQAEESIDLPDWDMIPDLPWAWINELTKPVQPTSTAGLIACGRPAATKQMQDWLRRSRRRRRPGWLDAVVRRVEAEINGNHHDTMQTALCQVAVESEASAYTAAEAVECLREIWARTTHADRAEEFESMLAWAVGQLDTDEARRRVAEKRARLR